MSYDQRAQRSPAGGPPRRGGGVPDGLLVGGLLFLLALTALMWTATGTAGLLAHGAWPAGVTFSRTAGAVRSFLTAPGDVPAAWPDADAARLPGATTLWLVFLGQVAVLFAVVLWAYVRVARWRARRTARLIAARAAVLDPAATREEPVAAPAPVEVPEPAVPAGQEARPDPVAAVLAAPEGLVVVDPGGTVWARTHRQREKRGPVHVYDPGHASDAPVRVRWAPQRGCEDMAVARRRAAALLAPVRPVEPVFRLDAETAETLLRCLLHAAALAGEPFPQVQRWALGRSAAEPAKVLRTHPRAAGGAVMELESVLAGHPGRRDAALELIARALRGLEQLHIRQACTPGRVDVLALDNLAGEGGTLYVVGDHKETAGLRAALVAAMTEGRPGLTVVGG